MSLPLALNMVESKVEVLPALLSTTELSNGGEYQNHLRKWVGRASSPARLRRRF